MMSCRSQVYKLVWDLHRIGITHEDLEPRNVARARQGGFCLIDFSESRRHTCKGRKVHSHFTLLIAYISGCLIPVFRTANITKLLVEMTALINQSWHLCSLSIPLREWMDEQGNITSPYDTPT
jgi:serine/threonine protein kinase